MTHAEKSAPQKSSADDPSTVSYSQGSGGIILVFVLLLLLLVAAAASMLR
jgi:hypothetical protein